MCHGAPLVLPNGTTQPLRIHTLLDDAPRYILAIEAFHSEREADMLALLVRALRRHDPPQAMYLDNGPTYIGNNLRLACERLGTTLFHAKAPGVGWCSISEKGAMIGPRFCRRGMGRTVALNVTPEQV